MFGPEGSQFSSSNIENLPFGFLTLFIVALPVKTTYGTIFILIWMIYALCFIIAWKRNVGFIKAMRKTFDSKSLLESNNFLFMFPVISSSLLVLVVLIQSLQETVGVPTGSIEFDNVYRGLFELAYSPIFEEIMFRISPFAVYYAILLILNQARWQILNLGIYLKLLFTSVLFPERIKKSLGLPQIENFGVRKGISNGEWLMTLLTSTIFGLAHYISGSGWEIGKITSSFLAGFVFCLAYLAFGFYAPILLHWFFNYYFHVYEVATQNYNGVFENIESIIDFTVQILGLSIILFLLTYLMLKLFRGSISSYDAKSVEPDSTADLSSNDKMDNLI
ncbi:CPBP family glutamic-type intramembrane protease [[Eubacterium] cellulosolvens]